MAQHFESVEEYISRFPLEVQTVLQTARKTIRAAAPGAQESISYAIPTFSVDGRPVVYLAGRKKHISIYPMPELDENLELQLVPWKGSSLALGDVQVRTSQGRRGRDTGSYPDRGERHEVRAGAPPSVKRFPFQGTTSVSLRKGNSQDSVGKADPLRADHGPRRTTRHTASQALSSREATTFIAE